MYSLITLVHGGDVSAELMALGGTVAQVMEGNFNGGNVSAHFVFADEADFQTSRPAIDAVLGKADRADACFFEHGKNNVTAPGLATGVHRTLFLCADHNATPERLAQFEAEMVQMAHYIPAIRNWRFSRVAEASGELPWTHVWEQEYDDIGGLMGPYMLHPYHWGFIDRWFDHECPDWMVNLRLCHSFAIYGKAVLS
jgi:hypothetical protein